MFIHLYYIRYIRYIRYSSNRTVQTHQYIGMMNKLRYLYMKSNLREKNTF